MKQIFIIIFLFSRKPADSQELFVYAESASNMAAKSIGVRLDNYFMKDIHTGHINYHLNPELMWGVSKTIMIHATAFISNRDGPFTGKGGSIYARYRFFSIDELHNHFRMAAYGRYSFNNSYIHEGAVDLNGHNSGYEGGLAATRLINKVAVSASSSILYAKDNGTEKFLFGDRNRTAVNYTLSAGKSLLPGEQTSFRQTTLNLMLEFLGETTTGNGYTYLDVAPSIQFIFYSRIRVDLGYRSPIASKLHRTTPRGCLLRIEYNIFNLY